MTMFMRTFESVLRLVIVYMQFLWIEAKPTSPPFTLEMCTPLNGINTTHNMQCIVPKGKVLDYRDIRAWSEKDTKGKWSFHITCQDGFVYLPWPFKAKNVVSLEVHDCSVLGLLAEMTITQTIPDELRALILKNLSIELSISEMINLRNNINNVERNTDCGQMTLEKLVLNDIHYDLKMTPEERDSMQRGAFIGNSPGGHENQNLKACVYNHLTYIDESGSRKNRQHYLKLIPEYSVFPVLEVYNMSNNDLDHIPEAFRNLHSGKFPSLRRIDFSHNLLDAFEFDFPNDPRTCKLEEVNLSYNSIIHISPRVTRQLKAVGKIMVDLRENPLRCSCGMVLFRQYLEGLYRTTSDIEKRKRVSEITCHNRSVVNGKFSSISLLDESFDMKCTHR